MCVYVCEKMKTYRQVQTGPSTQTPESRRALDKFILSVAVSVYV